MYAIKFCQELFDIYQLNLKENLNNKFTFRLKEKLTQNGMLKLEVKKDHDHTH